MLLGLGPTTETRTPKPEHWDIALSTKNESDEIARTPIFLIRLIIIGLTPKKLLSFFEVWLFIKGNQD